VQLFTSLFSPAVSAIRGWSVRGASNTTFRLGLLAVATVGVVVACDTVPLTSPTGSTITLSIDRSVLPLEGQATVTAVVSESAGTAVHNGTVVTFQPSIGSVNPIEAKTMNGVATATFMAGSRSGTGFIHAFSGAARTGSGNTSSGGVEVRIGAAAAGSLSVSATPSSVSQSGGTVTVAATVFDSDSNPLPGVNVNFTSTTGTLNPTSAITDAGGVARTLLTTTSTATVTAAAGTVSREVTVTASTAPSVQVAAPDSGTAGVPVVITVTATSGGSGNNTPRQIQTLTVDFGDGSVETRSNVTGAVGFTHVYGRAGGYTISATATDVAGNTGTGSDAITIGHAPQPTITAFSASPNPVPPADNGQTSITVTATPSSAAVPIRSVVVTRADGTVIFSSNSGGTFAYQFPAASGSQTIRATVTDANGETATSNTVVVVQ
jgi:hypothetical protein